MKLKDWADKTGIKYLTAYRWFKDGTLPVPAYQTKSGTIIVEEPESTVTPEQSKEIMSIFLKKTVEFSKNNATVEDFAAYVLSNFSLQPTVTVQEKLNLPANSAIATTLTSANSSQFDSVNMCNNTFASNSVPDLTNYGSVYSFLNGNGGGVGGNTHFMSSGIVSSINPTSSDIEKAQEVLDKIKEELQSTMTKSKRGRKSKKENK